jgi:hypothetical protein
LRSLHRIDLLETTTSSLVPSSHVALRATRGIWH